MIPLEEAAAEVAAESRLPVEGVVGAVRMGQIPLVVEGDRLMVAREYVEWLANQGRAFRYNLHDYDGMEPCKECDRSCPAYVETCGLRRCLSLRLEGGIL